MHLTKTEQEQTTVFGNRRLQALQDHADTDLTLFAKPAGPNEGHTRWGIGALGAEDKWILLAHDEAMYEIINSTSGRHSSHRKADMAEVVWEPLQDGRMWRIRNGGWERRAMAHMQL